MLLDIGHAVFVLGNSHRPGTNHALRAYGDPRGFPNLFPRDPASGDNARPRFFPQILGKGGKAFGVVFDEIMRQDFSSRPLIFFQHLFHDSFEQCYVSVDPQREKERGQFRAGGEHMHGLLGVLETSSGPFQSMD